MPRDKSKDSKSMPGMDMPADSKTTSNASMAGNVKSQTLQLAAFGVSGNCDLCKERIEKAAKSVTGVSGAVWDVKTKKIHVEFNANETNSDAVQKAIAKVGHDTGKFKASDEAYKQLPECCLYRK